MDEFEDRELKSVFGKLRNYESEQPGVSWYRLAERLPSSGIRPWQITTTVMVPLAVVMFLWFRDDAATALTANDAAPPSVQQQSATVLPPAQQSPPSTDLQASTPERAVPTQRVSMESAQVLNDEDPVGTLNMATSEVVATADQGSEAAVAVDLPHEPSETVAQPQSTDVIEPVIAEEPAISTEDAAERRYINRLRFGIDVFYLFGSVNPLKGDSRVIQDYQSKPGFGASGSLFIPFNFAAPSSFYLATTFQAAYKRYDFEVLEFEPERTYARRETGGGFVGYAGAGVMWQERGWHVASLVHFNLQKPNPMFSRSLLSLSVHRDVLSIGRKMNLTAGATVMTPVSREAQLLRYSPFLIGVGLRH